MTNNQNRLVNLIRVALYHALLKHPSALNITKAELKDLFFKHSLDCGALFGCYLEGGALRVWLQSGECAGFFNTPGIKFDMHDYDAKLNVYRIEAFSDTKIFSCRRKDCEELIDFLVRVVNMYNTSSKTLNPPGCTEELC